MSYTASFRRNNASVNTVDTNTNTMLNNIKSIEIILNVALSEGGVPASHVKTMMSKTNNKVISTASSGGAIRANTTSDVGSVYTTFYPMCKKDVDDYGKNNRALVNFIFNDGSNKVLNSVETAKFWNNILDVENAEEINFSVKANFNKADYSMKTVATGLQNGRFLSVRIVLNDVNDLFTFVKNEEYNCITLLPANADVNFHSKRVESNAVTIGFTADNDFFVEDKKANKPNFANFIYGATTSEKRREGRKARKAQSNAARKSVKDLQNERQVETTPVVETPATPVVDTEKEALRRENAELKAKVATLETKLDEQSAKLDQLIAMMAANAQPVAAPSAQVEEVTPEPEVVEEEPTVEETPVEEPKPAIKSRAAFFAGLNKAKAAKSQSTMTMVEAAELGAELFPNLMDDE